MRKLGLRSRLSASLGLLIAGFAGFFAIYYPGQQEQAAYLALEQRARSVSALLGNLGAAAIQTEELGGADLLAQDLKRAAAADFDINYIVITKANGTTLADYRRDTFDERQMRRELTSREVFERDEANLHVRVPLNDKTQLIGSLAMGLSTSRVQQSRQESQRTALLVSGAIVLIGLGFAWVISHRLATPLLAASKELAAVSVVLVDSAREQETTSAQEAAAVAETRRSMETLLDSAQQIADRSSEVLGNAERNAQSNERIAGRIRDLNSLGDKVAEILATIMQVADKADLLALNASLEGTKAGEAGKGFTLVAAEMRRLAENVMESVNGVRRLMKDMQLASEGAAAASQDGESSSADTATSARQIARLTQDQRQATEQVIMSMDEMSNVLEQSLHAVQRTNQAASDARRVAGSLFSLVGSSTDAAGPSRSADGH